ncbi:MAG: hypothetical protein HZC01_00700 [Candidatus Kerfeldbacteria bacterium]|nr:hypothetical protein [Candidatus Kerfeldbacteria bacterium]
MTTGDQHHKRHVITWLALVFITLVALNAVLFSYLFEPGDGSEVVSTVVCGDDICSVTEQTCVPSECTDEALCQPCITHYCPADCEYPTLSNTNANTNSATMVTTANGEASTQCTSDTGCRLVDVTHDSSDCCAAPTCTDYSSDDYMAVSGAAYEALAEIATGACAAVLCPQYSPPQCPDNDNEDYTAACVSGFCQKVFSDI